MGLFVVVLFGGYAQNRPAAIAGHPDGKSTVQSATVSAPAQTNNQSSTTASTASVAVASSNQPVDESKLLLSDSPQPGNGPRVAAFGVWDLIRMLLILGVVVGLIYGVFYLLKRSANGKVVDTSTMRILGTLQLPGNRMLYIVEAGRQVFLLSGGDRSLILVSEITDQESIDEIRLKAANAGTGARKTFSELLSGVVGGIASSRKTGGILGMLAPAAAGAPATTGRSTRTSDGAVNPRAPRAAASERSANAAGAETNPGIGEAVSGEESRASPMDFLRKQRERVRRLQ